MMPDLGKYTLTVLASYGVTLALLAGLVAVTVWQSRRVKARLAQQERRGQK